MSVLAQLDPSWEPAAAEAPAAAPDARELHLAAASEVEREGWIMMLHKATKVLQKASGASPPPGLDEPRALPPAPTHEPTASSWEWCPP